MGNKHAGSHEIDDILRIIDEGLGDSPARLTEDEMTALGASPTSGQLLGAIEAKVAQHEDAEEEPVRIGTPPAIGQTATGRRWGWPSRSR